MDPIFWLALSLFLVAISLTAVLVVALPALQELGRAARSVEKLFDTLSRELPPTLEAIRLTGLEISELTDDVTDSVKSAGQAAKQVEESLAEVRQQAQTAKAATRSVMAGVQAAWKTFTQPDRPRLSRASRSPEPTDRPSRSRLNRSVPDPAPESLGEPLHLPQRRLKSSPKPIASSDSSVVYLPEEIPETINVYEDIEIES